MVDAFWLIKLASIVLILAYFKILNRINSVIYIVGVVFLSILIPERAEALPEYALAVSTVIFVAYLFLYSLATHLKNSKYAKYDLSVKRIRYNYFNPFSAMLSMSIIFSSIEINGWLIFLISFLLLGLIGMIRGNILKNMPFLKRVNYLSASFFVFSAAMLLKRYSAIFLAFRLSVFYLLLLFVYYFIKNIFTKPYAINELKAGMLPAETVLEINGSYQKRNDLFSIYSAVQSKAFKSSGTREVISPFSRLTAGVISELKSANKGDNLGKILIQKTVDFRIFLVIGLIVTYLILKSA